jgi:hypothetical protein
MIAFCGVGCHECGAFLATQEDDDHKRVKVAQEWSRLFKVEIKNLGSGLQNCDS